MALDTLTPKQRRFADQYLGPARGNATEAARMAGYSDAEVSGYNCKQNQAIRAYIDERLNSETLSSAEVLAELTAIARAEWRNFVQERTNYKGEIIDSRLDLGDKVKALELLGKYHKLFTDKTELSGDADFLGALRRRVALDPAQRAGFARIRADPAWFIQEWMGADLWAKQVEIAEAVRDHRRVAVKSCHASGKSFLSARIVVWFLHAYPDCVIITTAPTYNQVVNILWREIGTACGNTLRPLLGRCLTTRYEIAPGWYALGFKASDAAPDRFQGFHAEHALVVIDEAAGVADTVFEALDAVLTSESAHLLLIGNPTNAAGTFYDAFHRARALYHTITIAAADTPNIQGGGTVRPYLITRQWVDDAILKHGAESDYVRCRVRAEFPESDSNALIPLAWIEAADARREDVRTGPIHAGLDVARGGGDECSLCIRQGIQVLEHHSWSGPETRDLMATVGRVKHLLLPYPALAALKVDVVGIGAGVHDRLKEDDYPAVAVNAGAGSSDHSKWQNLRCELYWTMRELFREGAIAGPLDDLAMGQGAGIRGAYTSRFTMPVIESKDDAKRRGLQSPDRFEALMLAFTGPVSKTRQMAWA